MALAQGTARPMVFGQSRALRTGEHGRTQMGSKALKVSMLVASAPRPRFMAAAIATAEFATMAEADSTATASIARITAIAIFIGAITAATIPITAIRADAGSSGPITARAASAVAGPTTTGAMAGEPNLG